MKTQRFYFLLVVSVVFAAFSAAARAADVWESVVWGGEDQAEEFTRLCQERGLTSGDIFWANDYASGILPSEGDVLLVPNSAKDMLPTWMEVQSRKSGGSAPLVDVKLHGNPRIPLSESEPLVTVQLHKIPTLPLPAEKTSADSLPSASPAGGDVNKAMNIVVSGDKVIVEYKPGTASTGAARPVQPGKMMWPVDGKISSGFGRRGKRSVHDGIDIPMPKGTPVLAAQDGVVVDVDSSRSPRYRGYGNVVLIEHGKDIVALYAHCTSISAKKGQRVRQGDVVGTVGNTGRTTTNHLHFEIRKNGKPVDPLPYLTPR